MPTDLPPRQMTTGCNWGCILVLAVNALILVGILHFVLLVRSH